MSTNVKSIWLFLNEMRDEKLVSKRPLMISKRIISVHPIEVDGYREIAFLDTTKLLQPKIRVL